MKAWHFHTKPNGVKIQATLYLTHISAFKSVCSNMQCHRHTNLTHCLQHATSVCILDERNSKNKFWFLAQIKFYS